MWKGFNWDPITRNNGVDVNRKEEEEEEEEVSNNDSYNFQVLS